MGSEPSDRGKGFGREANEIKNGLVICCVYTPSTYEESDHYVL